MPWTENGEGMGALNNMMSLCGPGVYYMQAGPTLSSSELRTTFSARCASMPRCRLAFLSEGGGETSRTEGWTARVRKRGRDAGVVASSAFQNMRPYFTDIYCSENVFSVGATRSRQEKRLYTFMGETR